MKSIAIFRGVTFEFPNGRILFNDLNLSLENRLAVLVGPNGVGKTCLARLLAGELEPTGGMIHRSGTITRFPQRQAPEAITVDEFLTADHAWSLIGDQLLGGIDRQALCTTLSGGQWMRVRLAGILNDSYLILDEPTNDLDREGREAIMNFLRQRGGGTLLISHDRECLELCEEVLELSSRGLVRFGGGWSAYEESRNLEREGLKRALEIATRERDQAQLERVERKARQEKRNRRGAAEASRSGMPRILLGARKRKAQASTGRVDSATRERTQLAVRDAREALEAVKVDPVMYAEFGGAEIPAQKLVVEAKAFNLRFQNWVYQSDLDFSWRGSVRIALKGPNGSGKSTLLKAITGYQGGEPEIRGELRRGTLVTLTVDQRCALLNDELSIFENIRAVSSASESEIRNGLAKFLFAKEAVFQKVRDLSGGERVRAALARGFLSTERPELLILDEPTNNLDLANIEFLEGLVSEFRGALIIVSHDEMFLKNCGISQVFRLEGAKTDPDRDDRPAKQCR